MSRQLYSWCTPALCLALSPLLELLYSIDRRLLLSTALSVADDVLYIPDTGNAILNCQMADISLRLLYPVIDINRYQILIVLKDTVSCIPCFYEIYTLSLKCFSCFMVVSVKLSFS